MTLPREDSTVLVTGATGFVGGNVVARVADRGHDVVASDLSPPGDLVEALWRPYRQNIGFVTGDVRDRNALERIMDEHRITSVVHAAAVTPDAKRELSDTETVLEVNILGTAAIMRAASTYAVRRVVYVSSASVYEPVPGGGTVLDEAAPLRTTGLYPLTKILGEWLALQARATSEVDAVSARVAACYGPLERNTGARTAMSIVWRMVRLVKDGKTLALDSPGHVLDLTHVQDVAEGICHLLEAASLRYDAYNVACGVGHSYRDLAETLSEFLPGVTLAFPGSPVAANVKAEPGSRSGRLDIGRLQAETRFEPEYDLRSGLSQYLGWLGRHPF
jgi:nucleoside-diphosphate-sugar epimerase